MGLVNAGIAGPLRDSAASRRTFRRSDPGTHPHHEAGLRKSRALLGRGRPAHPQAAREAIAKSESSVVTFLDRVTEIRKRDGCGHIEAMRKARAEHPAELSRYQNV
jgi:hypothetical protein